ncbi:TetR/AcrR family transcriptional regulator [Halalkalibacter sp. AB-rgal2]|uniref:TetR/AcrR family transcriptional regulator n=1 Tax=Halalkalibacter sp. AB-rgal2 TaxID=3242695 RepID=UPI00359E8F66
MATSRKDIQKERMWRYFVDATVELIEQEGIEKVTIRKIADKAGYTSSTVYNYFKELSHLIFFASMRFTKEYIEELPSYMKEGNHTVEKWLYSWKCFCKHSFENPSIYSIIFIDDLGVVPEELLESYYKLYRNDLVGLPKPIQEIIVQHSFSKRSALYIKQAVNEGFMEEAEVERISDITYLIWAGMMTSYLNNRMKATKEEVIEQTMKLITDTVLKAVKPEKRQEVQF